MKKFSSKPALYTLIFRPDPDLYPIFRFYIVHSGVYKFNKTYSSLYVFFSTLSDPVCIFYTLRPGMYFIVYGLYDISVLAVNNCPQPRQKHYLQKNTTAWANKTQ